MCEWILSSLIIGFVNVGPGIYLVQGLDSQQKVQECVIRAIPMKKQHKFLKPISIQRRIRDPPRGWQAALVLQTNGGHWVLEETRAHQPHAVVRFASICVSICLALLRTVEKASHTNRSQLITNANRYRPKDLSFRCRNGFQLLWYHGDTSLLVGNGCTGDMVDPDEWFDDLDLDSPC